MRGIYVAGPVVRQSPGWDLPPWVADVYQAIESQTINRKQEALMPLVDHALDKQTPGAFFHSVRKRIADSAAMVTVYTSGDASAAVETAIGSVLGKKILLIAEDEADVERMVAGLPGVEVVAASSPELVGRIRILMDSSSPHSGEPGRGRKGTAAP